MGGPRMVDESTTEGSEEKMPRSRKKELIDKFLDLTTDAIAADIKVRPALANAF